MFNTIYSNKIEKAIKLAITTHEIDDKQKRKGKDIPYITHPFTVGLILSQAGANEDVVIAGILHDTIEDSIDEKKVTKEYLAEEFGEKAAALVLAVTEVDKNMSWEDRKAEALAHIEHFSEDELLVKSADVLSNGTELVSDVEEEGQSVFERFSVEKEKTLAHSLRVIKAILDKWPENPLALDLKYLSKKLEEL